MAPLRRRFWKSFKLKKTAGADWRVLGRRWFKRKENDRVLLPGQIKRGRSTAPSGNDVAGLKVFFRGTGGGGGSRSSSSKKL